MSKYITPPEVRGLACLRVTSQYQEFTDMIIRNVRYLTASRYAREIPPIIAGTRYLFSCFPFMAEYSDSDYGNDHYTVHLVLDEDFNETFVLCEIQDSPDRQVILSFREGGWVEKFDDFTEDFLRRCQ